MRFSDGCCQFDPISYGFFTSTFEVLGIVISLSLVLTENVQELRKLLVLETFSQFNLCLLKIFLRFGDFNDWLLQYNYGGIQAKDVRPELEPSDLSQDPTQNGANEIVSSWNIAEFLPKVTQVLSKFTTALQHLFAPRANEFRIFC